MTLKCFADLGRLVERQDVANPVERHLHHPQHPNGLGPADLTWPVVAVARRGIHPRGRQQSFGVVQAQRFHGQAAGPREPAD